MIPYSNVNEFDTLFVMSDHVLVYELIQKINN